MFPFASISANHATAFSEAAHWILDAFARAEVSASKYLSRSGLAYEIGLDHLILNELIDLEVPKTFGNVVVTHSVTLPGLDRITLPVEKHCFKISDCQYGKGGVG